MSPALLFQPEFVPLAFVGIGVPEMIIIGIVGVLLFGSRLPEVGRSVGKSLMEFKKAMQGIETEIDTATSRRGNRSYEAHYDEVEERLEASAPKFEPPQSEPKAESSASNS